MSTLRVDNIKSRTGAAVSFPNTGLVVSGIVTASEFDGPMSATYGSFDDLTVSGITTTGSLYIDGTEVINNSRQLKNISSLDSVTIATIESAITNSPNTFTDLNVTGISSLNAVNSGDIFSSGIVTALNRFVGNLTGTASTATKLENIRTFEITGDFVASPQNFDGTQNVSLASSIQPNTVGLGTHTYGDYVKNITGTVGEIEVDLTSGEGVSPQIGLSDNVIIQNNAYVSGITTSIGGFVGNLTGERASLSDLNVSGILTTTQFSTGLGGIGISTNTISGPGAIVIDPEVIGDNTGLVRIRGDLYVDGTQTVINSTNLEVTNLTIGIGVTTSDDIVLDGAGIGIGSTGNRKTFTWDYLTSSLKSSENINLNNGRTYKINGNTVLSSNTLGNGVINSSLTSVGTLNNLNVSGITTSIGGFVGNLTGTATTATNLADAANITTGTINASRLSGTYNINVSGSSNYASTSGISTSVVGGIASVSQLSVSGVSTLGIVTSNNIFSTGIITASSGFNIGISSGGNPITTGPVKELNFIGVGNTFSVNGTTIDISIQESDTLDSVTDRGNVTTNSISVGIVTASSFVRVGGSSTQFLKADGSVDSTAYLSSYSETDTLNSVTSRGNITSNGISVGIVTASDGNFSGIVTANTGFNIGISSAGTSITSGPIKRLNFIGVGNTFALNGTTIDISIQGGGGGGESFWGRSTLGIHTLSNVGIATTNPIQRLQVNSRGELNNVVVATGATIGVTTTIITGISTTSIRLGLEIVPITGIIATGTTVTGIGSTSVNIGTATLNGTQQNNVTLAFAQRGDENVVVVTGIGSVGIGTTNPTTKLHVVGDINLDDGGTFTTTLQCITPTANRVVSVPDATGTLALVGGSSGQVTYNISGIQTGSPNLLFDGTIFTPSRVAAGICSVTTAGAANLSPGQFHGTWFTGGTSTSTKPYVLIEPLGTTSTNWITTGTGLGINAPSGFTGYLFDAQVASSRRIAIGNSGEVIPFNNILEQRNGTTAQILRVYNTFTTSINNEFGKIEWSSNVLRIGTDRNGAGIGRTMHLQVSGTTAVSISTSRLLQFEGETSSFPALKRNGAQLETRLADDSAYAEHAASIFQAARAFTVATLPSPPSVGEIARVTDATSPSIGSTVTGGGAANALVWYNGSAWTVIGV